MAIAGYSLCSSTLLLANKAAMLYIPRPSVVSFIQLVSTTVFVLGIKFAGVKVDDIEWDKVRPYALYILAFVAAIFANMKALSHSNVETVIVFRSCSPLAVTIVEYLFMGRSWPTYRSTMALLVVACGAVFYCVTDSELALRGIEAYYWVILYFFLITFEMTYGKKLTSSVKMDSVWGPVLYCNILALVPMFALGYASGEFEDVSISIAEMPANGWAILLFSCFAGTMIGYTGWLCRGMVSATTYTLVGVVNKFITVLLNVIMWDKHSTPSGILAVCVCLLAGMFYQQAPMRSQEKPTSKTNEDHIPLLKTDFKK